MKVIFPDKTINEKSSGTCFFRISKIEKKVSKRGQDYEEVFFVAGYEEKESGLLVELDLTVSSFEWGPYEEYDETGELIFDSKGSKNFNKMGLDEYYSGGKIYEVFGTKINGESGPAAFHVLIFDNEDSEKLIRQFLKYKGYALSDENGKLI